MQKYLAGGEIPLKKALKLCKMLSTATHPLRVEDIWEANP